MVVIANLLYFCESEKINELNIEDRIEIDLSEAEKYAFFMSHAFFSLIFFQPYIFTRFVGGSSTGR